MILRVCVCFWENLSLIFHALFWQCKHEEEEIIGKEEQKEIWWWKTQKETPTNTAPLHTFTRNLIPYAPDLENTLG